MISSEEYLHLCKKYISGECTSEEEEEFLKYDDEIELRDYDWETELLGEEQEIRDLIYKRVKSHLHKRYFLIRYAPLAAMLVIALSVGLYFLMPHQQQNIVGKKPVRVKKHDIFPGGNKAVLTLADGEEITLNDMQKGELARQGKTIVNKTGEGQLAYINYGSQQTASSTQINTITTPRGGQYSIVLPDGTKVWLNAASSLRFPTSFTGTERNVNLTGEAYFEVAKNKNMPFKVHINDMEVKVLGTHFNIMAYPEENAIKTTLLEGAVSISNNQSKNFLSPGQEGNVLKNGTIQVKEADVTEAIAWKEGKFIFNKSDIQSIMRQLSRWYDVEVVYKGDIPDDQFVGKINRDVKLSQVLRVLELSNVHFKIEDKRITIMP